MAESTYLILSSFEYFTGTNVRFDRKKTKLRRYALKAKEQLKCAIKCNRNPVWFNVTINYQMSRRFNPLLYLLSSATYSIGVHIWF